MKRAQNTLEFTFLIAIVLLLFSGLFIITINYMSRVSEARSQELAKQVAVEVGREIQLASQSPSDYSKSFSLPIAAEGYNVSVVGGSEIVVSHAENRTQIYYAGSIRNQFGAYGRACTRGQTVITKTSDGCISLGCAGDPSACPTVDDDIQCWQGYWASCDKVNRNNFITRIRVNESGAAHVNISVLNLLNNETELQSGKVQGKASGYFMYDIPGLDGFFVNGSKRQTVIVTYNGTWTASKQLGSTFIDSCMDITQPGAYALANSLVSSGTCIRILADNVTFHGNDFSITGSGTGSAIEAMNVNSIDIDNVDVRSFAQGVRGIDVQSFSVSGKFSANQEAIYLERAQNAQISASSILGGQKGIVVADSQETQIIDVSLSGMSTAIEGYGGAGLELQSVSASGVMALLLSYLSDVQIWDSTIGEYSLTDVNEVTYGNSSAGYLMTSFNEYYGSSLSLSLRIGYLSTEIGTDFEGQYFSIYQKVPSTMHQPTLLRDGAECEGIECQYNGIAGGYAMYDVWYSGAYTLIERGLILNCTHYAFDGYLEAASIDAAASTLANLCSSGATNSPYLRSDGRWEVPITQSASTLYCNLIRSYVESPWAVEPNGCLSVSAFKTPYTCIRVNGSVCSTPAVAALYSAGQFYHVAATQDGNYVLAGHTGTGAGSPSNIWIVKIDPQANLIWQREIAIPVSAAARILPLADGGYAVVGKVNRGSGEVLLLVRLDATGHMLWRKEFGLPAQRMAGFGIALHPLGGFMIASTHPTGTFVAGTDSNGNQLWSKTYAVTGRGFTNTSDGNYVIVGNVSTNTLVMQKIDASGNTIWTQTWAGQIFPQGWSVTETADGNIVTSGTGDMQAPYTMARTVVVKADAAGNKLWDRTYGNTYNYAWGLAPTADGGVIIVGNHDRTYSYARGYYSAALTKVDAGGTRLWNATYELGFIDYASSALELPNGDLFIVGSSTTSSWVDYRDVVFRTNSIGDIS